MTFVSDEYGRRTFEFIEKLQKLKGYDEIRNLIVSEFEWYGLTRVTSWAMPGPGEEGNISLNTRPTDYVDHYMAKQYVDRDPVVTELRRTLSPASWKDIKANRRLTKEEKRIFAEAGEFDADDGFTIPIITLSGSVGVFSPCGRKPDLSPRARSALEIIAVYSYQALQRARLQEYRTRREVIIPLTPREREVMKWVAAGKSDDEIGEILTISRETATTHVENAKRKLDATRRTYAVVQALRFGEISL